MTLALLAGNGSLPTEIIAACVTQGRPLLVIDISNSPRLHLADDLISVKAYSIGSIGKILGELKEKGIYQLVLAGGVERPNLRSFSLDITGLHWLKKLGMKAFQGDDVLLRGVTDLLQAEGFEILKPADILQNLTTPFGCLTNLSPSEEDWGTIRQGQALLKALSPFDVGQAVVIQQGLVLGIEAIEGTEKLLHRCGPLHRPGGGGILIKTAKDGQSLSVDLPSIGPNTVHQLKGAGLRGVALSAHTSQIIQQCDTVDLANQLGLFIVGIS